MDNRAIATARAHGRITPPRRAAQGRTLRRLLLMHCNSRTWLAPTAYFSLYFYIFRCPLMLSSHNKGLVLYFIRNPLVRTTNLDRRRKKNS